MKIRIYYEDTDAGGIVYHTNYIKYCERARSEIFFRDNRLPSDGDGSGFVVRHIDADFLGSAVLGDMIEVQTQVVQRKKASLVLKQSVHKEGKKIFEMLVTLVFVRDGKPTKIPEEMETILS